jgi:ABC-2 type transport system ATP-binding protein
MNNRNDFIHDKTAGNGKQISRVPPATVSSCGVPRKKKNAQSIEGLSLTLALQGRTLCEHLCFGIPNGAVTVLAPRDTFCKTALLNLLAGKQRPAAGRCIIQGREAHDLPLAVKQRVGILENTDRPYEVMTIGQTAHFFNGCYPEWRNDIYDRLTDGFGVSRRVKISNLPNHQRALVALSVLLARNPDILILDDYITTFGDETRAIVHDAIRRYSALSGKTTLLVGHHVGLTPDLIDNLVLVGHSTSLALPTAALFGPRSAVADKQMAGVLSPVGQVPFPTRIPRGSTDG